MSRGYTITFDWTVTHRVELVELQRIASRTLKAERVRAPAELDIMLTSDRNIRALNKRYRGIDAATDVLSFSQYDQELPAAAPPGYPRYIADVAISLETARRQAKQYGIPLRDEVSHLLVHGILHALGYDHDDPADEKTMRAREEKILGTAHHH